MSVVTRGPLPLACRLTWTSTAWPSLTCPAIPALRLAPESARASRASRNASAPRPQSTKAPSEIASHRAHPAEADGADAGGVLAPSTVDLDQAVVLEQADADAARRSGRSTSVRLMAPAASRGRADRSRVGRERQPDDVRPAAVDRGDERLGAALDRVAAGLALPLAAGEVARRGRRRARRLKRTTVMTTRAALPDRAAHHDAGIDPVAAAGEQAQAALGVGRLRWSWGGCGGRRRPPCRPRPRRRARRRAAPRSRRAWRAPGAARGPAAARGVPGPRRSAALRGAPARCPTWRSSASRRGEDEARMRGGLSAPAT